MPALSKLFERDTAAPWNLRCSQPYHQKHPTVLQCTVALFLPRRSWTKIPTPQELKGQLIAKQKFTREKTNKASLQKTIRILVQFWRRFQASSYKPARGRSRSLCATKNQQQDCHEPARNTRNQKLPKAIKSLSGSFHWPHPLSQRKKDVFFLSRLAAVRNDRLSRGDDHLCVCVCVCVCPVVREPPPSPSPWNMISGQLKQFSLSKNFKKKIHPTFYSPPNFCIFAISWCSIPDLYISLLVLLVLNPAVGVARCDTMLPSILLHKQIQCSILKSALFNIFFCACVWS